jgi:hypothetical protein
VESFEPMEMVVLTVKVEPLCDFVQLGNAAKMRRQMLNVTPIESLARFDKIQIMFLKLAPFYRLLLPILLAELCDIR